MTTETLIQANHLYRYYGDHCAVRDVSFELAKGDVLGFLGPNGAGKTSTMQLITGNLAPSAGRISVHGVDLLDRPKQAKTWLGYLPEQPPLYQELTVDEYLRYCGRLHRLARNRVQAALNTAKERCGLTDVGNRLIGNLSKGYQQRVGIAQAILHNPTIVVLDEPTVGLDPIQIVEIRALILELAQDHGIILSTHILPEIEAICTRVQIIHEGSLVFTDSIAGLEQRLASQCLVAGFYAPPAAEQLNDLPGVVTVDTLPDGQVRLHYEGQSPAEALVTRAASEGWRLYELVAERRTLEQIFVELTCRDVDVGGPTV